MSTNTNGSSFLKKYVLVCIVLDVIWAVLIATFGAAILNAIGVGAGAAAGTTATVSVLGWIIAFVIGLIQGGIFLFALSFIGFVFLAIFGGGRRGGSGTGGN